MTSIFQGLSLSRSRRQVGENPGNEVGAVLSTHLSCCSFKFVFFSIWLKCNFLVFGFVDILLCSYYVFQSYSGALMRLYSLKFEGAKLTLNFSHLMKLFFPLAK